MPVILLWGLGSLAIGGAIKLAGDGVEDSANGIGKLALVAALGGAAYLYAKKRGLI